jgi:hypothetical protein
MTAALGQGRIDGPMSGQQIYEDFMNAKRPGELQQAGDHLSKAMDTHKERMDRSTHLAGSMEDTWPGTAAEAAQRSASPLMPAHEDAVVERHGTTISATLTLNTAPRELHARRRR